MDLFRLHEITFELVFQFIEAKAFFVAAGAYENDSGPVRKKAYDAVNIFFFVSFHKMVESAFDFSFVFHHDFISPLNKVSVYYTLYAFYPLSSTLIYAYVVVRYL
ncbi:MAG: hypothetical protein ACD_59C00108G0001 [uncultured bacterium]|nr:MAG: hypothetical protein ACD_59C00108G0001 [uncultured bacterium]